MRTAHPKLGHKSLLIAECHRLRSMIEERDKTIEELERKLDPVKFAMTDSMTALGRTLLDRTLDRQLFGDRDTHREIVTTDEALQAGAIKARKLANRERAKQAKAKLRRRKK